MLEVAGERYDASPHYGPGSVGEVVLPLLYCGYLTLVDVCGELSIVDCEKKGDVNESLI